MRGRTPNNTEEIKSGLSDGLLTDADYTILINNLKKKALEGDSAAMAKVIDLRNMDRSAKAMDFVLNIVDYTIDDKSLVSIVKAADTPVVVEIIDGLARRLDVDEFSHDLRRILTNFRNLFVEEAETKYAPEEE